MFAGRGEDVKLSMESHHSQESVNFRLRVSDGELLRILNIIRSSSADYKPQSCLVNQPQTEHTDSEEEYSRSWRETETEIVYYTVYTIQVQEHNYIV